MEIYAKILGTVITLLILWLLGCFITLDTNWFINSTSGRIISTIFILLTIKANFED